MDNLDYNYNAYYDRMDKCKNSKKRSEMCGGLLFLGAFFFFIAFLLFMATIFSPTDIEKKNQIQAMLVDEGYHYAGIRDSDWLNGWTKYTKVGSSIRIYVSPDGTQSRSEDSMACFINTLIGD